MSRGKGEEGFSLLELIVAVGLTIGIMAVVFGLMNQNQEVFVSESNVTDMHQNVRVAMDLLTRDIQSAGMGLPRTNGSFAAIFYKDGASNSADTMLIINGDPYAPVSDVDSWDAGQSKFVCTVPPDVTISGGGSSAQFAYLGKNNQSLSIYGSYSATQKKYLCYDEKRLRVMKLTQNGMLTGAGSNQRIELRYDTGNYASPATTFNSPMDTGEPDYDNAKIAMLGSLIAYRVNQGTRELERTEDLVNWYSVARGVLDFQIQYRVVSRNGAGQIVESVTGAPGNREEIRAVEITISAETPDLDSTAKNYRRLTQKFEVASRNFNLLNNTNLSSNLQ
jgi:type II secretory pathway pseudopilin PulG